MENAKQVGGNRDPTDFGALVACRWRDEVGAMSAAVAQQAYGDRPPSVSERLG